MRGCSGDRRPPARDAARRCVSQTLCDTTRRAIAPRQGIMKAASVQLFYMYSDRPWATSVRPSKISACFPHLLDTVQKALMRCMLHKLLAASAIAIFRPDSGRDDVWKTACSLSAPVTSSTIHRTQIKRGTYPNFILVANCVLNHLRTNEKCATARKDAPTGETYAEMWRTAITGWSGTDSCLYRPMSGD